MGESVYNENPTILLVDDVELNRAILYELFHNQYRILEAENGQQALEMIENHLDSLTMVLLDIVMPILDGNEVLQILHEKKWMEIIPVIMITAENSEDTILRGYELGVSDIINKPFNPDIVKRRVENVIELYAHKHHLESMVKEQMATLELQAQKIKQTNTFVIDTLSTAVEFRNCESGLHIKRMRSITNTLLKALSGQYPQYHMDAEAIETIASAAAMHDIGKISIPDSVLLKPGKLTVEEFEIMKTHTIRGCEILQSLNYAQDEEYLSLIHIFNCDGRKT